MSLEVKFGLCQSLVMTIDTMTGAEIDGFLVWSLAIRESREHLGKREKGKKKNGKKGGKPGDKKINKVAGFTCIKKNL